MQQLIYSNSSNSQYNFILDQDFTFTADVAVIAPEKNTHPLISINRRGQLTIQAGYGFNKARFSFSSTSLARGSLIYCALCELIACGAIAQNQKGKVDEILARIAMEDGMMPLMSILVFWGQQLLGRKDCC